MNPFKSKTAYGAKADFYNSQFDKLSVGIDNAMPVEIFGGSSVADCRMYFRKYVKRNYSGKAAKTRTQDGVLWVAITEF